MRLFEYNLSQSALGDGYRTVRMPTPITSPASAKRMRALFLR